MNKKFKKCGMNNLNCTKFYVPTLNEEVIKNKNIHHCFKHNDKRCFDLHNIILKATSAVVEIINFMFGSR